MNRTGYILAAAAALIAGSAHAADAPDIALRPAPENFAAEIPRAEGTTAYDPGLNWGAGLLEPVASPDFSSALMLGGHEMLTQEFGEDIDWIARLELPLFEAPSGAQWGWLTEGRFVDLDTGAEFALASDARLRVSYDWNTEALFVLEEGANGWLMIRPAGAEAPHGGVAWTHPGFQSGPEVLAQYRSWEEGIRNAAGRYEYRNSEAVHLMRAAPSREAEIVHRIEGRDWDMEILELEGDWIRVRVSWPSNCGAAPREGAIEGWTVWRSADQGPWLYSPIGGC